MRRAVYMTCAAIACLGVLSRVTAGESPDVNKLLGGYRVVPEEWKKAHGGQEYLAARLDASVNQYIVIFWNCPHKLGKGPAIISSAGLTVFAPTSDGYREIWSIEKDGPRNVGTESAVLDLDHDGLDEILFASWVGASLGFFVDVYKMRDGRMVEMLTKGGPARKMEVKDLNGDGIQEIVLYARYGTGRTGGVQYGVGVVYAPDPEKHVYAPNYSDEFAAHYTAEEKRIQEEFLWRSGTPEWETGRDILLSFERARSQARAEAIARLQRQIKELEEKVQSFAPIQTPKTKNLEPGAASTWPHVSELAFALSGLILGLALAALYFRRRRAA